MLRSEQASAVQMCGASGERAYGLHPPSLAGAMRRSNSHQRNDWRAACEAEAQPCHFGTWTDLRERPQAPPETDWSLRVLLVVPQRQHRAGAASSNKENDR